ncbi:MAG: hypothetical protein K2I42_01420 [Anaeroplasmataceae bacterium]|nr:hypothetical protein [Anaeroplasmataceae bacterium]
MIKRKQFGIIVLINILFLTFMTSCKRDYANEMFEIYQTKDFERIILRDADIIPLGQYKKCDVACFHARHGNSGQLDVLYSFYIKPYIVRKPCLQTVIMVYNRSTTEMDYIQNAYKSGWISDDDLLHIIYKFDQASEQLSDHDWHKSENFVWDLEYYQKDK